MEMGLAQLLREAFFFCLMQRDPLSKHAKEIQDALYSFDNVEVPNDVKAFLQRLAACPGGRTKMMSVSAYDELERFCKEVDPVIDIFETSKSDEEVLKQLNAITRDRRATADCRKMAQSVIEDASASAPPSSSSSSSSFSFSSRVSFASTQRIPDDDFAHVLKNVKQHNGTGSFLQSISVQRLQTGPA
jgi:hypothetical protein